ncbi:MAG: ABC transporter ATP-binding protein [Thermoflexales bacterium]|nr:ABC transporter ATP-binding protein [Thermoflexales bacterium]MDW8350334.1 ABC transporter ATP-binding protein [Anaerolineae bacterium]
MTPALRVRNVSKRFETQEAYAVYRASLDIEPGQIVVLLGPSGCGKTTLLRLINGLEDPERDSEAYIAIGDRLVFGPGVNVPPERRRVGMVFQDYALFPHMTVAANVAFGLHGMDKAEALARTAAVLEQVQLGDFAQRYPYELSGGQQQRVALARALAPQPQLLLLDEPFSNLDHGLRVTLREEMRQVLKRSGVAVLFVTHDREEALSLADVIALMHHGRIVQTGTPRDLYTHPASPFVARFLGEANFLPAQAHGDYADCILGRVPLDAPAQGCIQLLIRPEALEVSEDPNGQARVEHVLYFGHDQLLSLCLDGGERLLARTNGMPTFSAGARVSVRPQGPVWAFAGQSDPAAEAS